MPKLLSFTQNPHNSEYYNRIKSSSSNPMKYNTCSFVVPCAAHQDRFKEDLMRTVTGRQEDQSRHKADRMKKEWISDSRFWQGVPEEEDLMKEWR